MANYKYDVVTLIELVEQRPYLWDKTNEDHKNKILRDKGWREIFMFLETDFLELAQDEKKRVGDSIMTKWTHIRDAFFKSRRTKTGQGAKKTYIYSEHLQFLLKRETTSNFSERDYNSESDLQHPTPTSPMQPSPIPSLDIKCEGSTSSGTCKPMFKQTRKNTVPLDATEHEILSEIKRSKEPKLNHSSCNRPDEKEIMLLSFLPYIKDMTETEMMDFQMETLNTIKKIKTRRALC